MTFTDLSDFCRLCLMPLSGSHVDCAIDDNLELKDTIKMVYNIEIKTSDEYSTKVCLLCCDILLCNTIHYVRAVEAQKSLTRIQRIKNKLRQFGKKKINDKKEQKQQLQSLAETAMIVDVDMIEIEPNSRISAFMECSEMDETSQNEWNALYIPNAANVESNSQRFFGNMTSFQQEQQQQQQQLNSWPTTVQELRYKHWDDDWSDENDAESNFSMNDHLIVPPLKSDIDQNNNNIKQIPSFFRMAKRFCNTMRNGVDRSMDEITKQLASLRFSPS